jgi:NACHT domain-containing protein
MLISIGEIVDGALINAIALTGRRISVAVGGQHGRRWIQDLTVARWFETYHLTGVAPALPELSPALTQRLPEVLRGDEIQAALQELLAARLTDAPETDAADARQVFCLTLIAADPEAGPAADALAGYYDDQICALVARLEGADPPLLAQIRSEAFSTRMINVLNAIGRHTAALTGRPNRRSEARFLASYGRHVIDQHGKLEPPDFDRRRRVPIADIYVPTTITEYPSAERAPGVYPADEPGLDVSGLAARLDRSVLLGDPGGGKTTAANVLMHHFASGAGRQIPFLVTLRDFAADHPPARSVAGYIEHGLETFYQCPPPPGLVDLLLLTGRAVVIFDGLDELLDTSRRADVATRVERFCAEYPLAPVLVTSRVVGYDQARLDDSQFTCYRLGGFGDSEVAEYARKWFAQDADSRASDPETFLEESAGVHDLRSNPLLLSLMCILYRGAGSLPRDRAGVYEQCADLLFRRWDARRRIHQELRAGHLIEPALRHLAGWLLFARDSTQPTVTERELLDATTGFLHDRGFEAEDEARAAAREFVEFCHGRMWVFSDAGTTVTGERLYGFTHRTFLEYFAAAQLAYSSDSPEKLATVLLPLIAGGESWVVAELAVQTKDRTSNGGAPRIYAALLADRSGWPTDVLLRFLALCLRSVDPSPPHIRELTRQLFAETCAAERVSRSAGGLTGQVEPGSFPLATGLDMAWRDLLAIRGSYRDAVADEISVVLADIIRSGDKAAIVSSLRLILSLSYAALSSPARSGETEWDFWTAYGHRVLETHAAAAAAAAETDAYIRLRALEAGVIITRQALDMPGGPMVLFQGSEGCFQLYEPYFWQTFRALNSGWPAFGAPDVVSVLVAFGEYLIDHPGPPWLHDTMSDWDYHMPDEDDEPFKRAARPAPLSQTAYLGAVTVLLIMNEALESPKHIERRLGPLRDIAPYLTRRQGLGQRTKLPSLPVPEEFKQTFRDWAEGRVNFTVPG